MTIINNIYKSNLDIIINWKAGDLIIQKHNDTDTDTDNINRNILVIDGGYFNFMKHRLPNFNNIIEIFNESFNHYLILISMSSNIKNIDYDFNELNNDEYNANLVNYLEKSLEGLFRFKEYYNNILEYQKLDALYDNCISQLDLIKNNNIIHPFYETNDIEEQTTYNNENDLFSDINFENGPFENNSSNSNNILTYISNILIHIADVIYTYTGFDITFGY